MMHACIEGCRGCPVCADERRARLRAHVARALGCAVADVRHAEPHGAVVAFVRRDDVLGVTEHGAMELDADGARRALSRQWSTRHGLDAVALAHRIAQEMTD